MAGLGKRLGPDDGFGPDGFCGQGSPEHGVLGGPDGNDDADAMLGHEPGQAGDDQDVVFIPEKFRKNRNAELAEFFRQGAGFLQAGDDRAILAGLKQALDQGQECVIRASGPETVGDKHYSCLLLHHVLCRL